jgi:arsenite/tail-anchored protein-transporting ATPase
MTTRSGVPELPVEPLLRAFDSLRDRSLILFGGKGGVGKTTIATLAALHLSAARPVVLLTTDPASNLADIIPSPPPAVTIEALDAGALYAAFLGKNLEQFLEAGERGTYLSREEIRRLLELSLPGIDELMAWVRIGDLVDAHPGALVVADTAPTGHTLRMLSSGDHFSQLARALEAMQAKHSEIVAHLTRRNVRDALDDFIDRFEDDIERRGALLRDTSRTAFVPVALADPAVVEPTLRLVGELRRAEVDVPLVVLNRAVGACRCSGCETERERETVARSALGGTVVDAPLAPFTLSDVGALRTYLRGELPEGDDAEWVELDSARLDASPPLLFFAGKGGVGKTTAAASVALQLAASEPVTLLSVDPAHGVLDLFPGESLPSSLQIETVDTRSDWISFREKIGDEIERVIAGFAPGGLTLAHDGAVIRQLLDIGPPGADEIFALMRISSLLRSGRRVVVDTAPTGHFLRLLDLPQLGGEWVRELMRLLLRYREIVPPGRIGEELLRISKMLGELRAAFTGAGCSVVVVIRAEPPVAAESERLIAEIEARGLRVGGLIANYLTPAGDCPGASRTRSAEAQVLSRFTGPLVLIPRTPAPPMSAADLREIVPLRQTDGRRVES